MKILQKPMEKTWSFQVSVSTKGIRKEAQQLEQIILLLHGLGERGKRIFRKLYPFLPSNALILAPNAPYLVYNAPQKSWGHAWYCSHDDSLSRTWLKALLYEENPNKLPLTIIGFSQGGYLAPSIAQEFKETQLVVGLGCEFRSDRLLKNALNNKTTKMNMSEQISFRLINIHGENDTIVPLQNAINQSKELNSFGLYTNFISLKDTSHEINEKMGIAVKKILTHDMNLT